ncbi:hypothetical protein Y032_0016g3075 [Ancylostoma ceylanicum]|uniref:Uncharacterized protein n=1 Tax=Ancylostoma ceylanicum TaxID=53326 RepID=A0A016V8H0_9BILA|nr:hypothetical protein Y032_0016g3075 [Ancylostoma ceylanicum]
MGEVLIGYSDKMSEGPQQKETSTMWLSSERHRDKKIRKGRSRKPEGPQQERDRILNSEDPETTFLRQNNVPAVGFQESLVFASEIATKCWKRSLRCMYPCESSVIVHYAREHLCELKHGFLRLP